MSYERGFTLIELLIVIALLGVLATIVIIAINPLEQLARGRDAGRKTTLSQLEHSLLSNYTSRNNQYPVADSAWITTLQNAGELQSIPASIAYGTGIFPCSTNQQRSYCYNTNGTDAIVYVRLESSLEQAKCVNPGESPYFLWASAQSGAGTVCETSDPGTKYSGYTFIP